MERLRSIEVDFDVHKRIELERRSFDETPNAALRRLLGIDGDERPSRPEPGGRAWSGKGVTLPHGALVRMEYNGRSHEGEIRDGAWHIEGKTFNSPSAAAGGVALTRAGKHPSLDGWIYWNVLLPGESEWKSLSSLRSQH